MELSVIRIDDRLIHGQIVTKWIKYAGASSILVVDDRSASDPMLKMILSLAVPSGIKLDVVTKGQAVDLIKNDNSQTKTLMIMKNPKEMLDLIDKGCSLEGHDVVLGNMSFDDKKTGVRHILDYIFVNDEDIADLKRLETKVRSLTIKAVPEENGKTIKELFG